MTASTPLPPQLLAFIKKLVQGRLRSAPEVDDVVQVVSARIIALVRAGRFPTGEAWSEHKGLVATIVYHEIIDRARQSRPQVELDEAQFKAPSSRSPSRKAALAVDLKKLQEGLRKLTTTTRQVMLAKVDMTYDQVADLLEIHRSRVQRIYEAGIKTLRRILGVTVDGG